MSSSDESTWPKSPAPQAEAAGRCVAPQIPGYEFIRTIASGGQGLVFEAVQKSTKRSVAIKVLHEGPAIDEAARRRFDREIELVAQLNHANIVVIFDSGTMADGRRYLVMDYIRGEPLDAHVRTHRLTVEQTLRLFVKVCGAVQYAHQRGIIHRDLKPSNIVVGGDGTPRVLDFGLAKWLAAPADSLISQSRDLMGTLPYMSPEQARKGSGDVDTRADVYSLGVVLYKLLTGKYPYPVSGQLVEVLRHITESPVTPPGRNWSPDNGIGSGSSGHGSAAQCPIDRDLETIVLKTLAKERERRYQSAGELARDVEHYLAGEPIDARRDSVTYLLRARAGTAVRKHPLLTCLVIIVFATLFTDVVGVPLVYNWTPINRAFARLVYMGMPPESPATAFADIRVIAITDETDLQAVSAAAGVDPEDLASDAKCFRQVHGRLMTRLALAKPAVVAWHITFGADSEYDAEFVRGVEALRSAGADVVVTAKSWSLTEAGLPRLGRRIGAVTRWGCTPAELSARAPWRVPLIVKRGRADPLPSLAVETFAAYRQPGCQVDLRLDAGQEKLYLLYWRPAEQDALAKALTGAQDEIQLSAVRASGRDVPRLGIERDDVLGHYLLSLPEDAVFASVTTEYGQVLAAPDDMLRARFAGKVVFVADRRGGGVRAETPDGRRIWSLYAHAAAVDTLLRGVPLRIPLLRQWLPFAGISALVGVCAGWCLFGSGWRRAATLSGCCGFIVLLSFWGAWRLNMLYNPLLAVLALVLAAELTARARGAVRPRAA